MTARFRWRSSKVAILLHAQAQKTCQLQNQIGLFDQLGILDKLRILLGRLNEKFSPNCMRFWLAGVATNRRHKHRDFLECRSSEKSSNTKPKHFSDLLGNCKQISNTFRTLEQAFPSKFLETFGLPGIKSWYIRTRLPGISTLLKNKLKF